MFLLTTLSSVLMQPERSRKSINYDSGFALRFPRFLRLRIDEKEVEDINTIDDIEMLYNQQRGK